MSQAIPKLVTFEDFAAWRPEDADAYIRLAVALSEQNKLDAAVAVYKKVIQLNPNLESFININLQSY